MPTATRLSLVEGRDRRRADRRHYSWRTLVYGALYRRRRQVRRVDDQGGVLDVYDASFMYLSVAVILLSCFDIIFTLRLLGQGATEVNPVMAWLLARDLRLFINVKLFLTSFGVAMLVAFSGLRLFRRIPIAHLLRGVVVMYLALIGWELYLLHQVAMA